MNFEVLSIWMLYKRANTKNKSERGNIDLISKQISGYKLAISDWIELVEDVYRCYRFQKQYCGKIKKEKRKENNKYIYTYIVYSS